MNNVAEFLAGTDPTNSTSSLRIISVVPQDGDVAITYGRYVSLFVPKNRAGTPGQLNSIWFERVYAKRDGRWMFLSHLDHAA